LTKAAITSARASPNESRSETGRRATMLAARANSSAAPSVAMRTASASSASDPVHTPPAACTTA
jgi:hypothetical protein